MFDPGPWPVRGSGPGFPAQEPAVPGRTHSAARRLGGPTCSGPALSLSSRSLVQPRCALPVCHSVLLMPTFLTVDTPRPAGRPGLHLENDKKRFNVRRRAGKGTGILVSFLPPHFRPNTSGSSFKIQKSSLFGIIDGHRPSSVDF